MIALTPTTELEAVNVLLDAIGHGPVDTLAGASELDVVNAIRLLREASRTVQSAGWWFNREFDYELSAHVSTGEVAFPSNAMSVIPNQEHWALRLVDRGAKFYSVANHTFDIGEDIKATVIFGLPFEQLPEVARHYLTLRGARTLKNTTEDTDIQPGMEESAAWVELRKADLRAEPMNMLNTLQQPQGSP